MPKRKLEYVGNPFPLNNNKRKSRIGKRVDVGPIITDNNGRARIRFPDPMVLTEGIKSKPKLRKPTREDDKTTSGYNTTTTTSSPPTSTTSLDTTSTAATSSVSYTPEQTYNSTTSMGKKNNDRAKGGSTVPPVNWQPTSSDFQSSLVPSDALRNKGQTSPVKFSLDVPSTYLVNPHELASIASGAVVHHKLLINISGFSGQLLNCTSDLSANNKHFSDYFVTVYQRYTRDVLNKARNQFPSSWTSNNVATALGHVCSALETYYTLDSILSYNPSLLTGPSKNKTLQNYQSKFTTSAILLAKGKLADSLRGSWFPPEYANLIRWFYQNYKTSDLLQSSCYRFIPKTSFCFNATGDLDESAFITHIDNILIQLSNSNSCQIYSLLSAVYPDGVIKNLPPSCEEIVFDPRHHEIFVNDPCEFKIGGTSSVFPISYNASNNDIPYYMASDPNNSSNGFASCLQVINTTSETTGYTKSGAYVGIRDIGGATIGGNYTNKWTYDFSSGTGLFYPRVINFNSILGSNDTHVVLYIGTTYYYYSKATGGFQRVFFNNSSAPKVNMNLLLDKLLSLKSASH